VVAFPPSAWSCSVARHRIQEDSSRGREGSKDAAEAGSLDRAVSVPAVLGVASGHGPEKMFRLPAGRSAVGGRCLRGLCGLSILFPLAASPRRSARVRHINRACCTLEDGVTTSRDEAGAGDAVAIDGAVRTRGRDAVPHSCMRPVPRRAVLHGRGRTAHDRIERDDLSRHGHPARSVGSRGVERGSPVRPRWR